ncbi:uncharacterized protein LOC116287609 [Actinia tenebrosa]|uniref:Uncharacterized protein LOC116287609 n=1 Tax=Actinia tenebrosa TaxID=6105 RepID=A0A6P8HCB1_ACTTE|nr:uncharacterized protein LOC116287609 [Actinia tenebrosa]
MASICIQICWLFLILQVVSVCGREGEADHASGRSRYRRQLSIVNDIYTLDHFIELVEKIEQHPQTKDKSLKEIANYVRKLGYDNSMWTDLLGNADSLPTGVLTSEEERVLNNMVVHRYVWSRELGVVKTPTGNVAMGHVMTGICAGASRKSILIAGVSIDNLYAATISGDLGQTALHKQIDQSRLLFGPGGSWSPNESCPHTFNAPSSQTSEATNAELLGDIDGFLLGYNIPYYVSKKVRLGQLLRMYYTGGVLYDTSFVSCSRKLKFTQLVSRDRLRTQVQGFMNGLKERWYGSADFSSVPSSSIPHLATTTVTEFFKHLDSISSTTTCSPQSNEGCELPANIIFVMDESGSIGRHNYESEKNFVIKVLDDFEISPIQTRVAIIEFSSQATLAIGLDTYGSKTRLKCAVEAINHRGGGTNTAGAVRLAYNIMKTEEEKSQEIQQIMILLTDGYSNNKYALEQEVKVAKANLTGVTMIAIGVGGYDRYELEMIATDPTNHVFTSTDFTQLAGLVRTLRRKTCETPARLAISFRNDGGKKTVTVGFVSPGKARYFTLPAKLFYGNRDINIKVTPFFGSILVYASRTNKNPGPRNYTYKLESKGVAGEYLNLHFKDVCKGYNETTCPPIYIAIQGKLSKLSCHDSHCTLPNQIKFEIAKGTSKSHWIRGTPSIVIFFAFIHRFLLYISY